MSCPSEQVAEWPFTLGEPGRAWQVVAVCRVLAVLGEVAHSQAVRQRFSIPEPAIRGRSQDLPRLEVVVVGGVGSALGSPCTLVVSLRGRGKAKGPPQS